MERYATMAEIDPASAANPLLNTHEPKLYLVHSAFNKKNPYGMNKEYNMSFIVEALTEKEAEHKLKNRFPQTDYSYFIEYVKTLYINEMIR
jgi:hypothetical protein